MDIKLEVTSDQEEGSPPPIQHIGARDNISYIATHFSKEIDIEAGTDTSTVYIKNERDKSADIILQNKIKHEPSYCEESNERDVPLPAKIFKTEKTESDIWVDETKCANGLREELNIKYDEIHTKINIKEEIARDFDAFEFELDRMESEIFSLDSFEIKKIKDAGMLHTELSIKDEAADRDISGHNTQMKDEATNNIETSQCRSSFKCPYCDATLKRSAHLDNHIIRKHPNFTASVRRKILECTMCSYKTVFSCNFDRHMISHSETTVSPTTIACEYCKAEFRAKMSLDDHIIRQHPNFIDIVTSRLHECPKCIFRTTVISNYKRHLLKHSGLRVKPRKYMYHQRYNTYHIQGI
ncbi:unnamed protein product [Acanthoscelides obtectus]|uniref:C2H2-type domain-containing protein n=1 Tax=Acanthoscelides obtectus TaxID=200917 RepID=A0A9P0KNY3_ACAOB|nr:unnamed protein product [Acanthoscelides obtectus]CAK1660456.1 Transcriptional repressor CTCF [Acanthoscelides obtectus]